MGRLVRALEYACGTDAVDVAGGVLWLQPAPMDDQLAEKLP